jgi:hypothetical protein
MIYDTEYEYIVISLYRAIPSLVEQQPWSTRFGGITLADVRVTDVEHAFGFVTLS